MTQAPQGRMQMVCSCSPGVESRWVSLKWRSGGSLPGGGVLSVMFVVAQVCLCSHVGTLMETHLKTQWVEITVFVILPFKIKKESYFSLQMALSFIHLHIVISPCKKRKRKKKSMYAWVISYFGEICVHMHRFFQKFWGKCNRHDKKCKYGDRPCPLFVSLKVSSRIQAHSRFSPKVAYWALGSPSL